MIVAESAILGHFDWISISMSNQRPLPPARGLICVLQNRSIFIVILGGVMVRMDSSLVKEDS